MAKVNKGRRNLDSQYQKPCRSPSCSSKVSKDTQSKKKHTKSPEKREWDAATCSVCMEYPHNAVLLLCSSYNKGCRPYMCATSRRFSNCLEEYKKAYTKGTEMQQHNNPSSTFGDERTGVTVEAAPELPCPLCRGKVKGWTVVEKARRYLNAKKRTCMEDDCNFIGSYKELRRHVKIEHPLSRPRAVDPALKEKWKRLERERERSDVISTIVSSTPGAIVLGDYVIERNPHGSDDDNDDVDEFFGDELFSLESFGRGRHFGYMNYDDDDVDEFEMTLPRGAAAAPRRVLQRLLFGRPRR